MDRALFRALSAQTGAKGVVLTAQQKPEKPTENLELSSAVVVSGKKRRAIIVHGEVGQEGDGPTARRLEGKKGQVGVDRARRANGIGALMARVHVGADRPLAKGVQADPVRAENPAAIVSVF